MQFALYGRNPKENDIIYVEELIKHIETLSSKVIIHNIFYEQIKDRVSFSFPPTIFSKKEEIIDKVSFLLSLGGDGTLLDTLPIVCNSNIPVLGINIGHLGFLTSAGRDDIKTLLEQLTNGEYSIEEHSLLKLDSFYALNDITIRSQKAGELLDISLYIDDDFLATYTSDGIIITSPTGSTAYNMSAGGPIITPKTPCFGITPICPHNLTFRPLIIPDNSKISLQVEEENENIALCIDSQLKVIKAPFNIVIQKADFNLKLVRMKNQNFFGAIRKKLMWGTYIRRG
ncbi:MAG: NAD(+)/NADH kinase [Bacteroidales bacterium]|jgi:NAD+ kinase|nr:NAD(+)/NADH kinase [Bacteroidales bacterium]